MMLSYFMFVNNVLWKYRFQYVTSVKHNLKSVTLLSHLFLLTYKHYFTYSVKQIYDLSPCKILYQQMNSQIAI